MLQAMKYLLMVLALAFGASATFAADAPVADQTEQVSVVDIGTIEVTVGDVGTLNIPVPKGGSLGEANYGGFKVIGTEGPEAVEGDDGAALDVFQVELEAHTAGKCDVTVEIKNSQGVVVTKLVGHATILPKQ